MLLTLDSSVIVAALRPGEPHHAQSLSALRQVRRGQHTAIEPLTVLVEVVAAVRRRTGSAELAGGVFQDLQSLSTVRFVELDDERTQRAAQLARQCALRGMDAIVVGVAQEFACALVTLDQEVTARTRGVVSLRAVTDL